MDEGYEDSSRNDGYVLHSALHPTSTHVSSLTTLHPRARFLFLVSLVVSCHTVHWRTHVLLTSQKEGEGAACGNQRLVCDALA